MLIDYPNLECDHCMRLYKSDDHLPECFRPEGCPVEDLATDEELTADIDKFLTAKMLHGVNEDARVLHKPFEELGLYDDPKLHLNLEITYSEWRQIQQTQHKANAR